MINKISSSKTNLYNNYLSQKPNKPGNNQNRASMKANLDSTQLNAQQNKLMMLRQQEEMIKAIDNEEE